jgi:transposase-like protein
MAETSKDAEAAFDAFIAAYELKYDKAAQCLAKDCQALLAFYDFPAEHWKHLRTSNPIESTFATVRHAANCQTSTPLSRPSPNSRRR